MTPPENTRPRRRWDLVLTILLLVLYLGSAILGSVLSIFLALGGDSCGAASRCDYDLIGQGALIVLVGPWVPAIFVIGAAIILLVKRRLAFWVPLVGIALVVGAVALGYAIAQSGVQPM